MARHQRPVSAVGDKVEHFKHDLSDQDLAPGRSHDGLGPRGEVPDLDRDVRHRAFFPPLVRIDDGSRSPVSERPRSVAISSGITRPHGAGVDDPFDRRSSDVRLDAQSELHGSAVVPVFQRHAGSNLSHRHRPPILTRLVLRVHRVFVAVVSARGSSSRSWGGAWDRGRARVRPRP